MGKKLSLPVFPSEERASKTTETTAATSKKPSVDVARSRLGGRMSETEAPPTGFAPGVLVTFVVGEAKTPACGVILFASQEEVHVLLDSVRLRRFPPSDLMIGDGGADVEADSELRTIAADAHLFGRLVEGQSVRYADDSGGLIDGKVIEKCRWGALVLRDDGAVVAVGFRKLWPAPEYNAQSD